MSAGADQEIGFDLAQPTANLAFLAPRFRLAVESALQACSARGLEAVVFETYRSDALQSVYFARGRTVRPPLSTVTNAPSNLFSWHGFGLAVDVIHREKKWSAGEAWFADVASVFKQFDCKWGGDWTQKDLPHFQWALCKPSPSDEARALLLSGGIHAVWAALQAAL